MKGAGVKSEVAKPNRLFGLFAVAALCCFAVGMFGGSFDVPAGIQGFGFVGFAGCVIGGIVASSVTRVGMLRRMAAQNYDWYRTEHPEQVTKAGVKCFKCGGGRIHVRGLMQRTYMREHFCTQCGTALYYSPEARG